MISKVTSIKDTKDLLGKQQTIYAPVPDFVYIAQENARCGKVVVTCKPGDHVDIGTVLGKRFAEKPSKTPRKPTDPPAEILFEQPIHSTVSGTIVGFEKHFHRSGKLTTYIKIENDHKDTLDPSAKERTREEIDALTQEDLINILRDTASVGLGGSSFPTYLKVSTKEKIHTIIVNAIECEPYITADYRIIMEKADNIVKAIIFLQRVFSADKAIIAIKGKHKEAIGYLQYTLTKYPGCHIEISKIKNYYPAGWEINMIKDTTGIDATGVLPPTKGILNFNVSTLEGIYEAVKFNRPVYERFVSVTGEGVVKPGNLIVRVGTPVSELIAACGGYEEPEKKKVLILGGPMMGAAATSEDCIATKTVTSILVFNAEDHKEEPCIRCGSCVLSCPVGLQPVLIMEAVASNNKERMKMLQPLRCIECGLCTYACTSNIRVTDAVRRAKIFAKL